MRQHIGTDCRQIREDFAEWWSQYPLKRGKLDAEKAYHSARSKRRATADDLLRGLAAYIVNKPEWQAFAYPATWIRKGCWLDDYSKPAPSAQPPKRVPAAYRPYVPLAQRMKEEA